MTIDLSIDTQIDRIRNCSEAEDHLPYPYSFGDLTSNVPQAIPNPKAKEEVINV